MMSVLIPIGAGIAGAMIIVMIAFAMKQCQFRIRRPVSRGDRDVSNGSLYLVMDICTIKCSLNPSNANSTFV